MDLFKVGDAIAFGLDGRIVRSGLADEPIATVINVNEDGSYLVRGRRTHANVSGDGMITTLWEGDGR